MTSTPTHYLLAASADPDLCVLDRFPSIREYLWHATAGVPVGQALPGPVSLPMSRRMGGKALADLVPNTLGLLVLSDRAASWFRERVTAPIEYLPLLIVDHKGRPVSARFWIANALGRVACVDRRASRYEESALAPGEFFGVEQLVLDPARVDPARDLFRIPEMPRLILVTNALAAALRDAALRGVELTDPAGPLDLP